MDFNAWLESQGWDRATLTESQLTSLQAAWRAQHNPAPTPAPTSGGNGGGEPTSYDALMSQFRQEQEREREITALAASALRDHPNQSEQIDQITKLAFAGRWTVKDTELALLRGLRQQAPSPLSRGGRDVSAKVLEAAFAMAAGLNEDTALKAYGATALEQAHTAFRGGLSLGELIIKAAQQNGYRDASLRGGGLYPTLTAAFSQPMSVGFSNVSLPGIFSNVANKFIAEGFNFVDTSWREVTAIRSTNDYKELTEYGMVGDYKFKPISKGGQISHATPGEFTYGNKVADHGIMLTLTNVDLRNDDLGALSSKGTLIGQGGGEAFNEVFWTEWNDFSDDFTAKGVTGYADNYADGTASAFDAEALEAATTMFRAQRKPSGDGTDSTSPLGIKPKILVVPSMVDNSAKRLMTSEKLLTADESGDSNVWSNRYKVVSPEYMEEETLNDVETGGLPSQWHLIADPRQCAVISCAFLDGNQTPIIESVDVSSDRLGIGMRGTWAFGVRRKERRARVTMKGVV